MPTAVLTFRWEIQAQGQLDQYSLDGDACRIVLLILLRFPKLRYSWLRRTLKAFAVEQLP